MKNFVRESVIGVLLLLAAEGVSAQSNLTIKPLDGSFRDSTTFLNLNYKTTSSPSNKYDLTLKFEGIQGNYQEIQVRWGDEHLSDKKTVTESLSFSNTYEKEGCFPIQMYFWEADKSEPDTLYAWALNADLSLDYEILSVKDDKLEGCLSYGADTLLLHFTQVGNPPLTRYSVNIICETPMLNAENGEASGTIEILSPSDIDLTSNWVHACWANQEAGQRDSIWLIFTEATGVKGAKISVMMECDYSDDKGNSDFLIKESKTTASVHLFDKPDLRQIFRQGQVDPFPDSLNAIPDSVYFNVCAPGEPNEYRFYGDWFAKYQTYVLSKPSPKQEDREMFKVQCYYTEDSVWTDKVTPGEDIVKWQDVTEDSEYFNDTTFAFKRAGFYMVRWEIYNQCNEEHPDTLWTSLIRKDGSDEYYDDKFRYIRVYENLDANMDYLGDSLFCLNVKDSVVLVDRNRRKFYDRPPVYSLTVTDKDSGVEIDNRVLNLEETKIYKGENILNTPDAGDISNKGCDSTTITLYFKDWGPGNYEVTLGRKGKGCDNEQIKTFEFHVGDVPEIRDTISRYCYLDGEMTVGDIGMFHCGPYEFKVPDLSDAFLANNRDIDSVRYVFAKGSKNSVLVYKQDVPEASFEFDSTDNALNYILVNIYNGCGRSNTDSVGFYTPVKPDKLSIWRDSVEVTGTDTLCVNAEYKYYLHGELPEEYEDSVYFSGGTIYLNETTWIMGGSSKHSKLRKTNENYGVVKYTTTGEYTESYRIINTKFPACETSFDETVLVMKAPDSMKYVKDKEILYCASIDTLDTRILFKEGDKTPVEPEFKRITWEWKGDIAAKDEKYPKLLFREGQTDTLYVTTIQSTNCYFRDTLIFKPQALPTAGVNPIEEVCVPDTLDKEKFLKFAENGNLTLPTMRWTVYKNSREAEGLVYNSDTLTGGKIILNEQSADSLGLIYWMQNEFYPMYPDFSDGGCVHSDTLPVKVYKPRLKILKKDTLNNAEAGVYDFSDIETNHLEKHDVKENLTWSAGWEEDDGTWSDNPPKYTLGDKAKAQDSLLFVLTGSTHCGDPIADTLVVYIPRTRIEAHQDTICANTADYLLWGPEKTTGLFVDTTTLEWNLISDASGGKVEPATGTKAKYIPGTTLRPLERVYKDTVKIEVKGSYAGIPTVDTILLWLNPAPDYTKLPTDTLIAIGQEIEIHKIKDFEYRNVSGLEAIAYGWARPEGDTVIKFSTNPITDSVNNKITAKIILKGLPGCMNDTTPALPMMALVYPVAEPKYEPLDMCAGEEYGVDSLFTFKKDRKDRFTTLKWDNEGQGSWVKAGNDTIAYKAETKKGLETIILKVNKWYPAYDGTNQWLLASNEEERRLAVNVHAEPVFGINPQIGDKDTVCKDAETVEITTGVSQAGASEWILAEQDYVDSLRFNGQKLPDDHKLPFTKDKGKTDTLYVTVSQGRCTQWASVKKELYVYRMDDILKSEFLTNYRACEGRSVEIEYKGTVKTPCHWELKAETGTLDSLGKGLKPVYADTSGIDGEIELHTVPHPGCEEEYVFTKINITKRPRLNLADKIVCKKAGNDLDVPIVFAQGNSWSEADSITWYRKGETAQLKEKSMPGDDSFSYNLTAVDVASDTFHLVAALWPKTPCDKSPTYDTIKIALSGQPEILLPGTNPEASMCQGDTLDLVKHSGVTVKNAKSVQWEVVNWGTIVADTLYVPEENSGSASLQITAKGVVGCQDDVKKITVQVWKAPQPDFDVNTQPVCQKGEIELEAKGTGVTVASYQWKVENQSYSDAAIKHTFENSGQVNVYLQQTYSYTGTPDQCVRNTTKPVTVNPKPTADFEDIGQVAKGTTVTIHNTSTPSDLSGYRWDVDGLLYPETEKDLTVNFNVARSVGITLTVTTTEGCSDSKSGTVEVVEPPVPDFKVEVDSCGNTAKFTLTGTQNGATVWWDWGKGQGFEQDVRIDKDQPIETSYDVAYQDTVYEVILELRNAADTVQKKLQVRFISRLEASFEILPEQTGCHEIYRKIHLDIKGRNDEGYIVWGDKWYNPDPNNKDSIPFKGNIGLLSHRFENLTLDPVKDTIRLQVKNTCFTVTDSDTLTILPATVSAGIKLLSGSSLCFREDTLKVTNASRGFDKATASWEWKFESNSTWEQSDKDTATHIYHTPGKYTVTLSMRDRCNSDTSTVEVTVKGNDNLYFDILSRPYCTDETVTMKFEQKGTPEFSDLRWTIYEMQSGNSLRAVADSAQITYKFTKAGTYNVLLTGKADGCYDRQTLPVVINATPQPMISLINGSAAEGCEPYTVEFQAAEGSGLRPMPHIYWDFNNGVKSSELKEKVVFETEGIYNVSLTLTSDSGCVNRDSMKITVKHTPRVSFTTDDSLFCTENGSFEVHIDNTSEDMERCRFEWFKKIGAGPEESIVVAPHLAPLRFENVSGTIGLRLFATDLQTGCVKNFIREVVASESVEAHIFKDAEYVCLDNPVYFASRTESTVSKVEWNMGNGEMSVDTAFEYTYDRVGDKMITLRVENKDGCQDFDTMRITVYPLPVADFEWKKNSGIIEGYPDTLDLPEVDNGGVEFTNYSIVTPEDWGTELYYSWNFGDSTALNAAKNPTHRFENNGLYEVWLKATTAYGCVDSVARTVAIDAVKGLYIPTAFAPTMPDEDLGEGNSYMGSARFQPKGIGLYSYQIQVYEPWSGTCVWSSTALKNGQPAEYWDGKFNGADAPAGNYIWKVKAIFIDGTVWQNEKGVMEGLVMLIR